MNPNNRHTSLTNAARAVDLNPDTRTTHGDPIFP
ncbi:hypothetical protein D893_02692 [Thioalkalivibrio sp. ALE21]|nr:hypothetical protein D893_02692 [Thioalkalivibrio sp. ALE21]